MKAVVKYRDGKDGWEIRDVTRLDPKDNEVEIQVKAAGICGSELHLYHDNHTYTPGTVIGHEFAGVISRVGKDVKGWKVGDRVVSENHKTCCWECDYCRSGKPVFCTSRRQVGYKEDGGWTSYICMPAKLLIPIPDNVSYEEAAMTEPCTVAIQALCIKAPVKTGETVLVQGCGTIGLINAMVAKAAGAGTVIVTGTEADEKIRLPIARKLTAIDSVINISREDLNEEIMKLTKGKGVDMVVEASGSEKAINSAIDLVRKEGRIVAIGETFTPEVSVKWHAAVFKACSIIFSFGAEFEAWRKALQLMGNKQIDLKPLITHRLALTEFEKGFQMLDEKTALKVMLLPQTDE